MQTLQLGSPPAVDMLSVVLFGRAEWGEGQGPRFVKFRVLILGLGRSRVYVLVACSRSECSRRMQTVGHHLLALPARFTPRVVILIRCLQGAGCAWFHVAPRRQKPQN